MSRKREPVPSGLFAIVAPALAEVLDALAGRGLPEAEVFAKRGRTRVIEQALGRTSVSFHQERGWAVRAGDDRGSFFLTATGEPEAAGPEGSWPVPDGEPLLLPEPPDPADPAEPADPGPEPWREPATIDAPLLGEREGLAMLATLGEELAAELPRATLVAARISDGASTSEIASSRGVAAHHRNRLAHLRAEAVLRGEGGERAVVEMSAAEGHQLDPRAVARRLADYLILAVEGRPPERDRAPCVLAPAVAGRLLAGLLPLLVGADAPARARLLADRRGRLASPRVTVVDDGRLAGGALAAPVDGEGMATGRLALIEEGDYRRPLCDWRAATDDRGGRRAAVRGGPPGSVGCMRRPSWRELPRAGPSHLFLAPDREVAASSLVADLARGYYLVAAAGDGLFDLAGDRFALPVTGFVVDGGRAHAPLAGGVLSGGLGTLLRGVERVGRDLELAAVGAGMIGSPSLLVIGLEVGPG